MARHLSGEERRFLAQWLKDGLSKSQVARRLGRARSTVGRELRRNSGTEGYAAAEAQRRAEERRRRPRRPRKMDSPEVNEYVRRRLVKSWSPDQIEGRSRREFRRRPNRQISRQTIYDWIAQQGELRPHWESFLRWGPRRRHEETRGKLRSGASIAGRPAVINQRRRFGDWEGDTVVSKRRRGGVLTLVERKSGYLRTHKVADLKSRTVGRAARRELEDLPAALRRSATFDNGKEFAHHEWLAKHLGISIFFADPYSAWQRGTNENTNGLLRQFFPKGTDFAEVSHHEVARIETLINERPRKRLGYRTPSEVIARHLGVAVGN